MRIITIIIVALAFAGVASAAPQSTQTIEGASNSPRVCFPKKDWGPASDRIRPCVRIARVEEDGSFRFSVSDGDGVVRYTSGVGALDR